MKIAWVIQNQESKLVLHNNVEDRKIIVKDDAVHSTTSKNQVFKSNVPINEEKIQR